MGGVRAERRVHLGRGGEPEGRARLRERLQQRTVGRPGESEAVQGSRWFREAAALAAAAALSVGLRLPRVRARRLPTQPDRLATDRSAGARLPLFVASEGNDEIALVRFGPTAPRWSASGRSAPTPPSSPARTASPSHPTASWYYVTTAHGMPNGALWKFSTETDEQAGRVELGLFPATVQVAPNGHYRLGGELQSLRRDGAVLGVGGIHRPHARGAADPDLRHAARLPAVAGRHAALLRLHDGRRAGGDRRGPDGGEPSVHAEGRGGARPGFGVRCAGYERRSRDQRPRRQESRRRHMLADLGAALRGRAGRSGSPATSRTSWWRSTSATLVPAKAHSRRRRDLQPGGEPATGGSWWPPTSGASRFRSSSAAGGRELARIPTTRRRAERAGRSRPTAGTRSSRSRAWGPSRARWTSSTCARWRKVASVDVGQQAGGIDLLESATP